VEFVLLLKQAIPTASRCGIEARQAWKGTLMHATKVLEHLKKHGQLLDSDIAAAINMSLEEVRASLTELSARGDISRCSITSYVKGKAIEGFQCRVSGYIPRPAPGRKPGVK
jgi:predicted ArsR family transcriptional regulator